MWTKQEVRKAAEVEVRKSEVWGWECDGDTTGQLGCKFPELGDLARAQQERKVLKLRAGSVLHYYSTTLC